MNMNKKIIGSGILMVIVLLFFFAGLTEAQKIQERKFNVLDGIEVKQIEGYVEIIVIDYFEGFHFDTQFYINNKKGNTRVYFQDKLLQNHQSRLFQHILLF